jgi:hypothetical protein
VALLAVATGVLTGFVAFRVTRAAPDRGLAADAARWQAQADAVHARERLQQALERGRAADAARWQAQADASISSDGSRRRSVAVMAGGPQAWKPNDGDARRPAQTGQVDQRRILSTLGVIATTVVAMTWRRRARSHLQEHA